MTRSWTIGSAPGCDLVVDRPVVSGRHCRLTRVGDGYLVEDLGSTNGTYVNGARVSAGVRVSRADTITLGQSQPMPWPEEASAPPPPPPAKVVRIGREADNDLVVNLPTVSGYHARIVQGFKTGGAVLEDLGSSNGTFLNGRRVEAAEVLRPGDSIGLGSYTFVYAPEPADVPDVEFLVVSGGGSGAHVPATAGTPAAFRADLVREVGELIKPAWRLLALLAEGLAAAVLIFGAFGTNAPAALSWLGLSAVWFGLSNALLVPTPDATPAGSGLARFAARFLVLGVLGGVQCLLAWRAVSVVSALHAPGRPVLLLLWVTSAVGLALGLAVAAAVPRPALARASLPLIMLLTWLLGGEWRPLPRMAPWARPAAGATPSRWAFEGLLLLESAGPPAAPWDIAEDYFPAETERMGVPADVTALGAMLLGLATAGAFIASGSKAGPGA